MLIRSFAVIAAKLVFAAFAIFAFSAAAEAQFLTFVSSTGVDTRPCTVEAQPCKTLPRAVAATSAGGTIRILSDLVTQPTTTIAKSLTVEGGGKSMIGTIVINNASAVVILRGLHLTGRGAFANGILIYSAKAVHIEDCAVERYASDGIKMEMSTTTRLFVSDTVSRANGGEGLRSNDPAALVEIDNSRFEGNGTTGLDLLAANMSVSRSVASGNGVHGIYLASGTANVTDTTASDNAGTGFNFGSGAATLASSVSRGNRYGVTVGTSAAVSVTDSVITSNLSYAIYNGGTLYTRGNNTLGGSVFGPAATPFSGY